MMVYVLEDIAVPAVHAEFQNFREGSLKMIL